MLLFYYYLFQLIKYIIKIFLKRDLNSDAIRDYLMMTWVISLPVSTFTDFTSQNFLLITELLPNTSSLLRRPYINSRSWKQQSLEVSWFSSPDPCKVNTQVQTDPDLHFFPSKNSLADKRQISIILVFIHPCSVNKLVYSIFCFFLIQVKIFPQ